MFVDASAIVAIVAREPDASALEQKPRMAESRFSSPVAMYEATLALVRIGRVDIAVSQDMVQRLLDHANVQIVSITPEIGRLAIEAFTRFGRGNHPARLNMGDCFAYACARDLGAPLLAKGGDFRQTDITLA
jgi:ribonuclease VapC